jgi:phage-related protein (TIGR01555 family)
MLQWIRSWWSPAPLEPELPDALPPVPPTTAVAVPARGDALLTAITTWIAVRTGQFMEWVGESGLRTDSASTFNPFSGIGGGGDKGAAARPNVYWMPFSPAERHVQFRRSGLTKQICSIYPKHAHRKGHKIEVAKGADASRLKRIEREARRLLVDSKFQEGGTIANRDGTYLLMGVFDEDPNWIDPATGRPEIRLDLPPTRIRKVVQLQGFERDYLSVHSWDNDLRSQTYGEPLVWNCMRVLGGPMLAVHTSRLLWFRGSKLSLADLFQNAGFDDSMADLIWDELRNKLQIGQVGATIAQELSTVVLKVGGKAGNVTEDMTTTFYGRMQAWAMSRAVGNVGIIGAEDSVQQVGSMVTGFKELSDEAWTALAACIPCPQTVLKGEPPGSGLNSDGESQRENWHSDVRSYQISNEEPRLLKFYSWLWEADGSEPKEWGIRWNPLDQPTERVQAETLKLIAEADAIWLDKGVVTPATVAMSHFGGAHFEPGLTLRSEDISSANELGNLPLTAREIQLEHAKAQAKGAVEAPPKQSPNGESGGAPT